MDQTASAVKVDPKKDRQHLFMQVRWHGGTALAAMTLWAAADSWSTVSQLSISHGFALLAALVTGILLAHIFHEWAHFAAARLVGLDSPVKDKPAKLMFDIDYPSVDARKFLQLGAGGSVGNLLFIFLVWFFIPLDTSARVLLFATAVGMLAYVAVIEYPVMAKVKAGQPPKDALFALVEPDNNALRNAPLAGVLVTIILWWLLA